MTYAQITTVFLLFTSMITIWISEMSKCIIKVFTLRKCSVFSWHFNIFWRTIKVRIQSTHLSKTNPFDFHFNKLCALSFFLSFCAIVSEMAKALVRLRTGKITRTIFALLLHRRAEKAAERNNLSGRMRSGMRFTSVCAIYLDLFVASCDDLPK